MRRLINAFWNSRAGITYLLRNEAAFRTEVAVLFISIPLAWWIATSLSTFIWLVGSILMIMIVEMLNTGIEQVCNGLSREYMEEIKVAKDCGSAAVLFATMLAGAVWLGALYSVLFG